MTQVIQRTQPNFFLLSDFVKQSNDSPASALEFTYLTYLERYYNEQRVIDRRQCFAEQHIRVHMYIHIYVYTSFRGHLFENERDRGIAERVSSEAKRIRCESFSSFYREVSEARFALTVVTPPIFFFFPLLLTVAAYSFYYSLMARFSLCILAALDCTAMEMKFDSTVSTSLIRARGRREQTILLVHFSGGEVGCASVYV